MCACSLGPSASNLGIVLNYRVSSTLVCVECRIDLLPSCVNVEEQSVFIVECGGRFSTLLLVLHLHRHAPQLPHTRSERLKERPRLRLHSVCYERQIRRFHSRHRRSRCSAYLLKKVN